MVTVLTRTIGPSGRDYASFTLAEADVTNIGTSADLVANDEAIVFEADAGTYNESVIFSSTLTTDATRQVTYKPAAGSEHGGVRGAGVHVTSSSSFTLRVLDQNMALVGLSAHSSHSTGKALLCSNSPFSCDSCIFAIDHGVIGVGAAQLNPGQVGLMLFTNCVFERTGTANDVLYVPTYSATPISVELQSCTLRNGHLLLNNTTASGVVNIESVNALALGSKAYQILGSGTVNASGSNNFGPATNPFPAALQGSPYPITPTTSFSTPLGSGDYAVYMGATGALADVTGNDVWQQGVGPASNSDVPTTDINGVTRSGTSCNPGAFEADGFVEPTVLTRTIGPTGRDFSTFTLAEAAVTSIGSGTDLTFYNEAIVFEADAGTYNGRVDFQASTLTTDPTRNVTYRAAAGQGHNGIAGQGPHLVNSTSTSAIRPFDNYLTFDGLSLLCDQGYTIYAQLGSYGTTVKNCVIDAGAAPSYAAAYVEVRNAVGAGAASLLENNSIKTNGAAWAVRFRNATESKIINCTLDGSVGVVVDGSTYDGTLYVVNNLSLGASYSKTGTGVLTLTGSNNFGGSTNPFPAAIQGSPYPITPTTNVSPGVGDFAIYVAETGQLVDSDENDVIYQGVGPSANSDVPTTGISGGARYGTTAHPGAFATLFGSPASSPLTSSGFNSAEHLNQLEAEAPWIWLYELQTTDDPPKRYRMTNFTESVEFGMNSSGQPLTYSPTPIIHSDVEEGSDGSLPTITITVGHAGPIVASTVDAANGFVGQPIRIMLVSSLDLSASKAVIRQDGEVVAASITPRGIAFRISAFNLYQLQFPPYIFARRRCRWIFGSAECGYNTDAVGAGFSVCEKTLDACRARGDDEVSLGLPRQHPARFGGWPGIPRAGR